MAEKWTVIDNTKEIERLVLEGIRDSHARFVNDTIVTAQENAPVDTGELQANIKPLPQSVIGSWGRGVFFSIVIVDVPYGIYVHEGFYHILAKKRIPANPFLLRAVVYSWPDFMKRNKEVFTRVFK